jgi:RHS repeat-associated protein
MTDGGGTVTSSYDALNRVTGISRASDTFSYTYDAAGNIATRQYPDNTTVAATYDEDNRLHSVASGGATTTYAYDEAGNPIQTTLPSSNGYVETRTFDKVGRLTELKNASGSSVLSDVAYTLDNVGNPTSAVRTGSLASTTTYNYDANNRLTDVCFQTSCSGQNDPFIRWTYDKVGNRLSEVRPDGTTTFAYDAKDAMTSAGSITYSYDANGNETAAGSRSFSYDLENRTVSTTDGATTTSYTYDGDGNRLQASTGSQANEKTNYLWDTNAGLPEIALERNGNNTLLRRYIYGQRRISMTTGSASYYYQYDPIGSVLNLTSSAGATEWTYDYEPFGKSRSTTQDDPNAPANPLQFTGEALDGTGIYYLRARNYDSATGRFTSGDPLPSQTACAQSAYAYVANRPTVLVDPSGQREWSSSYASTCVWFASSNRTPPSSVKHDAAQDAVEVAVRMTAVGKVGPSFEIQQEYRIPGSGPNGGAGRADVALLAPSPNPKQAYFWEIKPDNRRGIVAGGRQLARYVANAPNRGVRAKLGYWLGMNTPVRTPAGLILVRDAGSGLVVYHDAVERKNPPGEPCAEPQPFGVPLPSPGPVPVPGPGRLPLPELIPVPA